MTTSYSRKMQSLLTEQRNPRTMDIDRQSIGEILETIHREDHEALAAVGRSLPQVEQAVETVVNAFRKGGRLVYVGAGTSGRLGVLDAAECPPTFSSPPWMVQGIIAGGYTALHRAIEGAEDYSEHGAAAIQEKEVCNRDVVMGIAASGVTPFVLGALQKAADLGASTLFLTCTPTSDEQVKVDIKIVLLVGPEAITGSTRMKAGTATKLVLNMITTTAMIKIGKVYQNLMVDLTATCNKLVDRAHRILVTLTGLTYDEAGGLLSQADMRVKTALVMHICGKNREEADILLAQHDGLVHRVIESWHVTKEDGSSL
ncbi:MAG: N-acetylmuramic acid 6-phosphate etherase [bacterium]